MKLIIRAVGTVLYGCGKFIVALAVVTGICLLIGEYPTVFGVLALILAFAGAVLYQMCEIERKDRIKAHRRRHHGEE